ncbi:hypothetical protein D1007_59406 [Hordeum vulgare]|nr:hypothetical protein D1007_59406 [Hordeum vulgare]
MRLLLLLRTQQVQRQPDSDAGGASRPDLLLDLVPAFPREHCIGLNWKHRLIALTRLKQERAMAAEGWLEETVKLCTHGLAKKIESKDHSRHLEIPENVKNLVFKNICGRFFGVPAKSRAGANGRENKQAVKATMVPYEYEPKESDGDMRFLPEFQEVILIRHIATDIFLMSITGITEAAPQEHVKAIKVVSDYMMFLATARPHMVPGLDRSLYEITRRALEELRSAMELETSNEYTSSTKEFAEWMLYRIQPHSIVNTTIRVGARLAQVLLSLLRETTENVMPTWIMTAFAHWIPRLAYPPVRDIGDILKFIFDSWVGLLVQASIRRSRESHAKQLGCGGDLTTIVWMMAKHARD